MTGAAQCVVVLDTNVLHSVRLYLSYAKRNLRYPYGGAVWGDAEASYIRQNVDEPNAHKGLIEGGKVFHFMHSNRVELARSAAVETEMFNVEASSRALRTAVMQSAVDGRWFSKLLPEEVNTWLSPQDRRAITESLDHTFTTLDSFDIRVSDLDPQSSSDVMWIARGIMTMVYMDPMDSVVYANALVAAATHLVTSDGRFRDVVNRFKNPSSGSGRANASELSSLLRICTGMELRYSEFPVSQKIANLSP